MKPTSTTQLIWQDSESSENTAFGTICISGVEAGDQPGNLRRSHVKSCRGMVPPTERECTKSCRISSDRGGAHIVMV